MIIIIKNDNNYEILMVCFSDAWCCCNVQSNLMVKTTRQTAKSQPTWQCLLSLVVMNWQLAVLSLCQKSFLAVTLIQLFVLQLAPLHNCLHQLPSLRINTSVKLMSQGRSRHREYDRLDVINVSTVWQLTAANVTRVGQCIFTHFGQAVWILTRFGPKLTAFMAWSQNPNCCLICLESFITVPAIFRSVFATWCYA